MRTRIIAISGGIGSGKSVVCNILRAMGWQIYDCDSRAKALMDSSQEIKRRLKEDIDDSVISTSGAIDRKLLSNIVFNNTDKLAILNSIVHQSVREDIASCISETSDQFFFIETAILYQSGIDRMVDAVWEVTAPEDIRIRRVMRRNRCTAEEVSARINSQIFLPETTHPATSYIINDDIHPVLPQIETLMKIK